MRTIGVLDYGMGNLRSVTKALEHVGASSRLMDRPEEAEELDGLVVPGVGAFGACMEGLRARGLDEVIRAFVAADVPVLGGVSGDAGPVRVERGGRCRGPGDPSRKGPPDPGRGEGPAHGVERGSLERARTR